MEVRIAWGWIFVQYVKDIIPWRASIWKRNLKSPGPEPQRKGYINRGK